MKSQRAQNRSIAQKNNSNIQRIFSETLKSFGFKVNESVELRNIILRIEEAGYEIYAILGKAISISSEIIKQSTVSSFRQRFFGNLLFDKKEDEENYLYIMKMIDERFIINRIEIKADHIFLKGSSHKPDLKDNKGDFFDVGYPIIEIKAIY